MTAEGLKFGAFVRREREAREIGLREMAKKIGVSPTYLSKVERDEFRPPTEDKVRAIAQIIECDPDELLALAGRMPSDLADIIKRAPVEVSALLRTTSGMTRDEIARLATRSPGSRRMQERPEATEQPGRRPIDADDMKDEHTCSLSRRGGHRARRRRAACRI